MGSCRREGEVMGHLSPDLCNEVGFRSWSKDIGSQQCDVWQNFAEVELDKLNILHITLALLQ